MKLIKARKVANFIKQINGLIKNWEFYTKDNTGVYYNKLHYHTYSGSHLFTKYELIKLLEFNKRYLNELLK